MSAKLPGSRRAVRSTITSWSLFALTMVGGVVLWPSVGSSSTGSPVSHVGPEGVLMYHVRNLASSSSTISGKPVDGITCRPEAKETVKYHIHVHVAIYVDGTMVRLPAGVGITKPQLVEHETSGTFIDVGLYDCLYWLHTHVADGIIHVEAPYKHTFTLGEFFDIWHQPLGPTQVGPAKGTVTAFENGKRFTGNPRSIPLLAQAVIQLDVGKVVPFHALAFKVTGSCGEGTSGCSTSAS